MISSHSDIGGKASLTVALERIAYRFAAEGAVIVAETVTDTIEPWRRDILSEDECHRLDRFVFERDRHLYLTTHSLKRLVLGRLCGQPAEKLDFGVGTSGRPFLLKENANVADFNVSHSGQRAVLAVVARGRIGVDVQLPESRYAFMLSSLRHPKEYGLFPEPEDFTRLWTLKEAVSKAIGTGLSEKFETLQLIRDEQISTQYQCVGWRCNHVILEDGHHLAVASDSTPPRQPVFV